MNKPWFKKFQRRIKKILRRVKHREETFDFEESQNEYKLVSLYLSNFGDKKKKGVREPPVSGQSIYYVIGLTKDKDGVRILHPILLEEFVVSKRQFEKGIVDVWWPNEAAKLDPNAKNKSGCFCNRFKVADTMLKRLEDYARREKLTKKIQETVREAIADLKEIPLDKVPKYKLPERVDHLKAWKESMAKKAYKKQASSMLTKLNKNKDEGDETVSSKKKGKKEKTEKDATKAKGKKGKAKAEKTESKPGEVKAPRGKKTAVAVVLRYLLKHKGKKVKLETLQQEVQKAKGMKKEFPEKKIMSKVKQMTKWAEKNELSLKASSSGLTLS